MSFQQEKDRQSSSLKHIGSAFPVHPDQDLPLFAIGKPEKDKSKKHDIDEAVPDRFEGVRALVIAYDRVHPAS